MLDITSDIQSLTTFRRSSCRFHETAQENQAPRGAHGERISRRRHAGRRSAISAFLDIAARADAEESIRQGLDDVSQGRTRPAREVFDKIRRKHGISN